MQSIQNSSLFTQIQSQLDLVGFGDPNLEFSSAEANAVFACEEDLLTLIIFAYAKDYLSRMLITCRFNTTEEFAKTIFEI